MSNGAKQNLTVVQMIRDDTYGQLRHAQNLRCLPHIRNVFVAPEPAQVRLPDADFVASDLPRRPNHQTFLEARRLAVVLRAFDPDIIHSHSIATLPAATLIARSLRVPLVHSPHALPVRGLSGSAMEVAVATGLVWLAGRRGASFIAVSKRESERLVRLVPRHRVRLALNPVPPRYLAPADGARHSLLVLSLSRFWPQKAPLLTIEAFARILAREPAAQLLWAGDGPLFEDTRAHARRLGIDKRVTFLGPVDDPLPFLHRGAVLLSSSSFEAMPYAILEAMASGCAVVATDIPAHRELDAGTGGLALAPADPVALGDAACELLLNQERLERARALARRTIEERHTISAFATATEDAYFRSARPASAQERLALLQGDPRDVSAD